MEKHPEQNSEWARLQIRQKIHNEYSRVGYNLYDLAYLLLDLRPSEQVLDVGCGLGDFLIKVRSNGHLGKLVGIEQNADVIDIARKNAEDAGVGVDIRLGNAESIDLPSGTFDCVTALHVLGKGDRDRILSEIGRILKLEGRVVVSTWSRSCFPMLQELKRNAREHFGWFLSNEWTEGFDSESAPEVLRQYFGNVEEFRYEDVLEYPDAEVLVDFFRSTRGLWGENLTEAEWDHIVDWARDQAIELIPEHGYAEDPKSFSLFRCTAPLGL